MTSFNIHPNVWELWLKFQKCMCSLSIQCNLQLLIQNKLLRRRLRRWSNFEIQFFIYSYEENVARIFLFYFNKICNKFLNKVQQGDYYTQLCNYREEFVCKPISNQLNILVGCNLSFTWSVNVYYLEMDE